MFEEGFRADLLVDGRVIVEVKSLERLAPVHAKPLRTYLRLAGLRVGLLVDFGAATLREGLVRIVEDLPAAASPALRVNRPGRDALRRAPPRAEFDRSARDPLPER